MDDIMTATVPIEVGTKLKWAGFLSSVFEVWIETDSDAPPMVSLADEDTINIKKLAAVGKTLYVDGAGAPVLGVAIVGLASSVVTSGTLTINVWQRGGKRAVAKKPLAAVPKTVYGFAKVDDGPTDVTGTSSSSTGQGNC